MFGYRLAESYLFPYGNSLVFETRCSTRVEGLKNTQCSVKSKQLPAEQSNLDLDRKSIQKNDNFVKLKSNDVLNSQSSIYTRTNVTAIC